jgi:hypothetical protein
MYKPDPENPTIAKGINLTQVVLELRRAANALRNAESHLRGTEDSYYTEKRKELHSMACSAESEVRKFERLDYKLRSDWFSAAR